MALVTEEQYEAFAELAEDFDCYASPDYSGRGMYGRTCLSVSGDPSNLHSFMFRAARLEGFEEIVTQPPSHDAMGLGQVQYWRGVQVEGYARDGWI